MLILFDNLLVLFFFVNSQEGIKAIIVQIGDTRFYTIMLSVNLQFYFCIFQNYVKLHV